MSQSTTDRVRWTTSDLELLPESSNRYEIIDGELFVTRAPHWGHQKASGNAYAEWRSGILDFGLAIATGGSLSVRKCSIAVRLQTIDQRHFNVSVVTWFSLSSTALIPLEEI